MFLARTTAVVILILLATLGSTSEARKGGRGLAFQRRVPAFAFQPAQPRLWRIGGTQFLLTDGSNFFVQDQNGGLSQVAFPIPQWLWPDMKTALQLQPVNNAAGEPIPNLFSNGSTFIHKTPGGFQSLPLMQILGKDGKPIKGLWGDGTNLWWNVPDQGFRQMFFSGNQAVFADGTPVNQKAIDGLNKYWGEDYKDYFAGNPLVSNFLTNNPPAEATPAVGESSSGAVTPPRPGATTTTASTSESELAKTSAQPAAPTSEEDPPPVPVSAPPVPAPPTPAPTADNGKACGVVVAWDGDSSSLAAAIGMKKKGMEVKLFLIKDNPANEKAQAALNTGGLSATTLNHAGALVTLQNYFNDERETLNKCASLDVLNNGTSETNRVINEQTLKLRPDLKLNMVGYFLKDSDLKVFSAKMKNACVIGNDDPSNTLIACFDKPAAEEIEPEATTNLLIARYWAPYRDELKGLWPENSCVQKTAALDLTALNRQSLYDAFWEARKRDKFIGSAPVINSLYRHPTEGTTPAALSFIADSHLLQSVSRTVPRPASEIAETFKLIATPELPQGTALMEKYKAYEAAVRQTETDADAAENVQTLAKEIIALEREAVESARKKPNVGFSAVANDPCSRVPAGAE